MSTSDLKAMPFVLQPSRQQVGRLTAKALLFLAIVALGKPLSVARAAKPTDASVIGAIQRGSQYLCRVGPSAEGGRAGIAALGLLKSGTSPDDPAIEKIIDTRLLPKFQSDGTFHSSVGTDQYYEAGVDLMVYLNSHPEAHEKEITTLVKLLLEAQHEEGYWTYPPQWRAGDRGDTSITQYALLGLWDAQRHGINVPIAVFERAASWLAANQDSDGAFWYHPGNDHYKPTQSVVAAGSANLLVCGAVLFGVDRITQKKAKAEKSDSVPLFGVLKKVDLTPSSSTESKLAIGKAKHVASGSSKVGKSRIDSGARRGMEWLDRNWIGGLPTYFRFYYYYALERACTLSATDLIGDHDWYDEISDSVLKDQQPDGGWNSNDPGGPVANTAFALLFLSRATARLIRPGTPDKFFGGGLMIGGRGLPTNLGAIQSGADGLQVRKLSVPVDQLLSELENPKSTEVEAVQKSIVEQVELGDPEKLIGQRSRLIRLARDPRPEVRRTAIWALGRCATIHEVQVLVKAIDDSDYGVVLEANNALCWFSRRPNGFGRPADPVAALPDNLSDQQKSKAALTWRKNIRADWRDWYENVRLYSERSLPIDLP
jgi:HEAT repeats